MKLLNIGTGVIGTTYAWQIAEAGHKVTVYVRPGRKAALDRDGIRINYTDLRTKPKEKGNVVFRPEVVESFSADDDYAVILVSVLNQQLESLLPLLAQHASQADILFFLNLWSGTALIEQYLDRSQFFFGFAHTVGGGRKNGTINTIIFREETQLGEVDGTATPRLLRMTEVLKDAVLNPEINDKIVDWLTVHYVQQASSVGGMLEAGSVDAFLKNSALVKRTLLAYREGVSVCRARGIRPEAVIPMPWFLLHAPMFVLVPAFRKIFSNEDEKAMLEGHLGHGVEEMVTGYFEVLRTGERLGVPMPHWKSFEPAMNRFTRRSESRA
jgi:ketopantoate reductase